MPEPLLQVNNLKMYFPVRSGIFLRQAGWVKAVDDVSFSIYPGETLGLVGESGCGKSTLLRILAGADKPDGGSIEYGGHNAMKNPKIFREYAGYVPQDNPLFENLTVSDNLKLWYCDHKDELSDAISLSAMRHIPLSCNYRCSSH